MKASLFTASGQLHVEPVWLYLLREAGWLGLTLLKYLAVSTIILFAAYACSGL